MVRAQRVRAALIAELARRTEAKTRLEEIARDADAVRERCQTLPGFIKEAWHVLNPGTEYKPNWHIDAIAEHMHAIHRKEINRFLCNMPPGMMKSLTIGVMFPAWEWTTDPWLRYFTTSYEAGYARRDSRYHRNLIESEWYQSLWPQVTLVTRAEEEFENTARGARKAVPYNRLTSGRGNRLIIDDPHSIKKAESETERDAATLLFRESAQSRLNDPKTDAIIVVMQRLHPDDLSGVIDQLGLGYVKLVLPMEYNRSLSVKTPYFTDPRTRDGELLHPERMGQEDVEREKIAQGSHAWDTQYNQQPRARDGSYFFNKTDLLIKTTQPDGTDEYHAHPQLKQCDALFAIIDTATKVGKKRDGTGVGYFGFNQFPKPHGFLLDWDIMQMPGDVLETWLPQVVMKRGAELAKECGARRGFQGAWIEDKDSGQVLIMKGQKGKLPVKALPSGLTALGKDGRALSVSGYVNKGLFKITKPAWDKTSDYKGHNRNHFVEQFTTYRMGHGTANDEDELFDIGCYGCAVMFGDQEGM